MDDVDKAFVDSVLPEGAVSLGFLAVVVYIHPDGGQRYFTYSQMDLPYSGVIGHLEMAKHDLLARRDKQSADE